MLAPARSRARIRVILEFRPILPLRFRNVYNRNAFSASRTWHAQRRHRPHTDKMSIFGQKSKFRVQTEVRRVRQVVEPTPRTKAAAAAATSASKSGASGESLSVPSSAHGTPRGSPNPSSSSRSRAHLHAATSSPELGRLSSSSTSAGRTRRAPPASARATTSAYASPALSDSEPGSDDDDDWRDRLDPSKRRKRAHTEDPARRLRHTRLWAGQEEQVDEEGKKKRPGIVHAAEVASLAEKCQPVMGLGEDEVAVRLRYPGANSSER